MIRFLAGLIVGSVGTAACMYGIAALLPATSETPDREPLVGPRDPDWFEADAGPLLNHYRPIITGISRTSGDGHVRWTPSIPT